MRQPLKKLIDRFPNGINHSLYVSEQYLKPFSKDISSAMKIFYNKYDDIPYSIKVQIESVYHKAQMFEKERVRYSSNVVKLTKGISDTINSENAGGVFGGLLSTQMSLNETNHQEKKT